MSSQSSDRLKRVIDLLGASFGLWTLLPTMLLTAAAIRLDSNGPALFKQVRAGKNGEPFVIYKFRTMRADYEIVDVPLTESDPSITRVGKLLRATSLDELPQLINVLRGEMSLVGPRPTIPEQVEQYDEFQRRRLEVKPGLTGWAQVNGRSKLAWDRRIELDVWYVDNRSFALDMRIVWLTLRVLAQPALTWDPADPSEEVTAD